MLNNSKSDCCCPEARCCTPETVTATVAGMMGTVTQGPTFSCPPDPDSSVDACICGGTNNDDIGRKFNGSLLDYFIFTGRDSGYIGDEDPGIAWAYGYFLCFLSEYQNYWLPHLFPPTSMNILLPPWYCTPGTPIDYLDPDGPVDDCVRDWSAVMEPGVYPPFDIKLMGFTTNNSKCDPEQGGHPLFCQKPESSDYYFGGCGPHTLAKESDLNGTYVCHRPDQFLRPQVKCRIHRSQPLVESPYRGATEAALLYNTDPRRTWVFLPPPNECWDVMFPPEGDEYCIDYRCGKRNPWYSWNGFGYCERGKCTVTNQGVVKPHLYYYNELLGTAASAADVQQMQSANLYLRLIPRDYEQDEDGRFPTWWRVGSVDVIDGGYGYQAGQFFQVDFDVRRPWLGGEIMTVYERMSMSCMPPYYPTWIDKYGYGGELITLPSGDQAWRLYQRLRISEVDENGGIVSVEVVPIFKNPEYKDPPLCLNAKTADERTKFYTGYGRVLCHPRSVQFPGVGYNVGDQIEFYCDDPPCEVVENAVAVVSDVDDEGGILDWRIRGSDFPFGYATAYSCDETDGQGNCIASCFQRMPGSEPDQRGKYKWKAKLICDLYWHGVGVPVRTQDGLDGPGCLNDGYNVEPIGANSSDFTELRLNIARVRSETSIETILGYWPYGAMAESSDRPTRIVALFPPFPNCFGGGAVVEPLYGQPGDNESDFGSKLIGTRVHAGGGGYCYKERRHVEPTLPLDVPAIGGGSGARIASYEFRAVHNYPSPATPYGDSAPPYDRYSYFPVTGADIDSQHRGSGYEVGQTFDVSPAGGREVGDMWAATGGDAPEQCPHGAWYGGERSVVLESSDYMCMAYNTTTGYCSEPTRSLASKCTLRISEVDENGGIVSVEVVHGGMMFRTEYTHGKLNPLVSLQLTSTLGYGAEIQAAFQLDYESAQFGQLLSVTVVPSPAGTMDPKHPGVLDESGGWIEPPQPMPVGGRDYADESCGYFWMLRDTAVGAGAVQPWGLLAHLGWTGRGNPLTPGTAEPRKPRNQLHPAYSTHEVLSGSVPFQPVSSVCSFNDCYHELLTRTYPLVRVYNGSCSGADPYYYGPPFSAEKVPPTPYALLLKKNRVHATCETFETEPAVGRKFEYVVVQYGPTLTLNYTPSSPCPDHTNGTPTRE